tara:strand:- start:541 stop:795 length:255 start_codon:yes stop_codon:yes gene_type:complete
MTGDFSETKPFKRKVFIKTKIWNPLWIIKKKGLFLGALLLIVGGCYFFDSIIKNERSYYYIFFFCLPGLILCLKALNKKEKRNN